MPPSLPIEDELASAEYTEDQVQRLHDMFLGFTNLSGGDDAYLLPLSFTSGQTGNLCRTYGVSTEFLNALADLSESDAFQIVGSSYRTRAQQAALKKKKRGALVLLMREPGNDADVNAVAVLVAQSIHQDRSQDGFRWRHVGYLPKAAAAHLAPHWYEVNGIPVILHATIRDTETANTFTRLSFSNEYSSTVIFRDVSFLFTNLNRD
jgi:hypothetical protein